jgi:3D-(3,5/4)-trihydroxycyclohexane-1,2-dione acylhydrolase (decyclizing)
VTTSIGPGATNVVTAAALAYVNRLPLLIIPGDVFANRAPDPVLQQVEDFADGTVSANDCFRPVSRYFDRITRPEHILTALPRALRVMTDPAECGPVTLAFCQDVQAEAYDYPESFFTPKVWRIRRPEPDQAELAAALAAIRTAAAPVIVAGGGVIYSGAEAALDELRPGGGDGVLFREHRLRNRRSGDRPWHAVSGFHHRVLVAVQEPGAADTRDQCAAL